MIAVEPLMKMGLRVAPVVGGIGIIVWRVRETRVPLREKAIIIPPLGMATGFGMFFAPPMRVPWTWAAIALIAGATLLALPLVHSTKLVLRDGVVWMQRSRAFLVILLALLGVRLALHDYIGHLVSPLQTAALFYLLAFGMIVRWRVGMYRDYKALTAGQPAPR